MGKNENGFKRIAFSRNQRYLLLDILYAELDRINEIPNPLQWHSDRIRDIEIIIKKMGWENNDD